MKLFSNKSKKLLGFYYDKSNKMLCFDDDQNSTLQLHSDGYHFVDRCDLIPYEYYELSQLLDADFITDIRFDFFDYININKVRSFLYSYGYINNNDFDTLLTLGFDPDDTQLNFSDVGLRTREINVLTRAYIDYLWELVLYEQHNIRKLRDCGDKTYQNIVNAVISAGYSFYDQNKAFEIENDKMAKIHKILSCRARYISIIDEYNSRLDKVNEQLEEEVKRLLKI